MENQRQLFSLKKITRHFKYGAVFVWAFTGTMLIASSVVQASDLQIYAVPTAGKKTIVMMLDTSGSMNPNQNSYGENRILALKNGMNAFLNSNNLILNEVRVGLGHYSVNGDGKSGRILVKAEKLGPVGSTQRTALKNAVAGLSATGGTPTAHAYAEAAAYLMGTSTRSEAEIQKDLYKKVTTQVFERYECQNRSYPYLNPENNYCYQYNTGFSGSYQSASNVYSCPPTGQSVIYRNLGTNSDTNRSRCYIDGQVNDNNPTSNYRAANLSKACLDSRYPYLNTSNNICYQYQNFSGSAQSPTSIYTPVDTYYQCINWRSTDFTNSVQYCGSGNTSQRTSTNAAYWTNLGMTEPTDFSGDGTETVSGVLYSYTLGMQLGPNADSGFDSSIAGVKDGLKYISPLPAEADRVSCDGQGVYVLSDGEANNSSVARSKSIMSAALESYGTSFSCPSSGGLNTGTAASWHCMGELAKKLFNKASNPAGVSIQTAFVGFGSDFNRLTETHVQQACKLSSRTQSDRTGDDACSPNQGGNAVANPGYGNGGFFTTQTAEGVTDSVIAFINNLGPTPLAPLTTGAISVPADALSPSGLQPYGYLRALEPNPQSGKLAWAGNLKRYKVLTTGANAGAFAGANGSTLVYNADGSFKAGTKDLWNSSSVYNNKSYNDGGIIGLGGAYSRVPMPINGQIEDLTVTPQKYEYAENPNGLRKLFTDVAATGGTALTGASNGASLLRIPEWPTTAPSNVPDYVLGKFGTQTTLQDMPLLVKQKLLNYLGYSVPLDATATALPTTLPISATPHLAMGGSIHSFPVQMTYSGTLDASGNLTSTRSQSILYGTMDGGLHIVDSSTGVEQMVFVPAELLRNTTTSKALVKGETDATSPQAGLDGAWVADSLYVAQKASSSSEDSVVKASRMNVYGGLRMGGESYYGLNVLDPTSPKFLFRIGRDQTNFSRMGQSWSKPVLANIRYNNQIRRVMIVGGGYDACYEDPTFTLAASGDNSSCTTKTKAQGNAVYVVDATTGARLWWTSDTGADTNNTNMKHSIVSRISAIDRNGDGLVDHLYFGDLGGQVFRADLNNIADTTTANFGKRVVRLANLATDTAGTALTTGKNPRFYEAPTVTIHDQGATTFMLIGIAAGNRSTPLDVYPIIGRDGMSPATALNDRLVNNVYGIIDRDFIKRDLITGNPSITTQNIDLRTLQKDPQTLSGNIPSLFIGTSTTIKNGWYRSLSSNSVGTERADNSFRIIGGMKAFEEPIALTGNLIVPVYDPQGTGIAPQNPCLPRVVGETNRQRYCLPFGVCLNSDGSKNNNNEEDTGFKTKTTGCPAGVTECNDNTLGAGIVGITPAPITEPTDGSCPDFTIAGNEKGTGKWQCIPTINPTRWYERWK
ncbi:VWA domain-containing protein [Acinetobacter bohemicus]|uniref:Type IV pilus assembly protein PilY1 n=2 Tax=Pseudomonadota TaxID=1224 RepID=A0A1I6S2X3_9GAMM|nr:PilC/PilY family type IV pilus protein [Acinetobacter bohemicus]KAB0654427.1 VWA domain-containing protein [Acinetobacter bohemicus]SFS71274.1 type IV pilus assembly protein PilY1 [Acinetobacter bohemicus]